MVQRTGRMSGGRRHFVESIVEAVVVEAQMFGPVLKVGGRKVVGGRSGCCCVRRGTRSDRRQGVRGFDADLVVEGGLGGRRLCVIGFRLGSAVVVAMKSTRSTRWGGFLLVVLGSVDGGRLINKTKN